MEKKIVLRKILIATGGTGGHIYPALVTARILRERGWDVLFIGRLDKAQESLQEEGFLSVNIQARGFVSVGVVRSLAALWSAFMNFWKCVSVILRYRPSVVLGFGGYSSVPAVLAGIMLMKKTMIHEQNASPGLANKVLAKGVHRIALTFRDAEIFFPKSKTVWTGCPLRGFSCARSRAEILQWLGFREGLPVILVFGGSQGARAINDAVLKMLEGADPLPEWQIIHLTGEKGFDAVRARYASLPLASFVRSFSGQMADLYSVADVVVARSGAGTVTELGLLGIPAVLIPYPHADEHQRANACVLKRLKTGVIIDEKDLNGDILRDKIFLLIQQMSSRAENQERAKNDFAPDAGERLSAEIDLLVRKKELSRAGTPG
jgi:UDP-N-acetylglucosamine--N-acetylmuramyl-(pentapeptide) pyrophosphoryl-undecaprenol N-acetylglucosamine transferase